jgi:asparagine synthase (glutamine-hydrolysing)
VSEAAARNVKVILSGDGGDELFGGYTCYALMYRDLVLSPVRPGWHRTALEAVARHGWPGRVRGWAGARLLTDEAQYRRYRRIFGDGATLALMNPEFAESAGVMDTAELARFTGAGLDPVTAAQAQDVGSYMLDDILTKVDRMSMACSLEVRVPLLDHTVAELAFTLPTALRVRPVRGGKIVAKYILKRLAERFFPVDLVHRPKMGFGIPVDQWCRGALAATIEEGLRDPRSPVFEWLDFEAVQETLDGFFYHARVSPAQVWCLMMLALWSREIHAVREPIARRGPTVLAA